MANELLLQAIAVTAELTGTELTKEAARVFADDLTEYPLEQVLAALKRCRQECRGRMSIADVISRIDDGRPTADEAWAMIPRDEDGSTVWTQEMATAFGLCASMIGDRDATAARMAFRGAYERAVKKARDRHEAVHWFPSLGRDPSQRAAALENAVEKGRISAKLASALIPIELSPGIAALLAPVAAKLTRHTP